MDIQWHVVTELDSERREAAEARIQKLAHGQKDLIHVVITSRGANIISTAPPKRRSAVRRAAAS